jgi:hypothetical protein
MSRWAFRARPSLLGRWNIGREFATFFAFVAKRMSWRPDGGGAAHPFAHIKSSMCPGKLQIDYAHAFCWRFDGLGDTESNRDKLGQRDLI